MLYVYFDNQVFFDLAKGLVEALHQLGWMTTEMTNTIKNPSTSSLDLYIMFGMNDFNGPTLPDNYIVYQLEQTTCQDESHWFSQSYINCMKNAIEVWDYSLVNYQNLRQLGITKVRYVPLTYMSCLCEIIPENSKKQIDLLFYGSVNPRRQNMIDQLRQTGLNVRCESNLWGTKRCELLAQSKVVINLHYYHKAILETTRLSYLLSNQCVVISEHSRDPLLDKWHQDYLIFSDPEHFVETCQEVISHYPSFLQQYQKSFRQYQMNPYSNQIPLDTLKNYQFLLNPTTSASASASASTSTSSELGPPIDSHDLFEAEYSREGKGDLVLKLPQLTESDLPLVSVVTVTYNRQLIFPMAIRNWINFIYPRDKLEWVIVDDSDDGTTLSGLLPKSNQIKYYRLQTTGRLSIGQKRNFGVEHASHDYIAFMDDDDYYYPHSIYARVALLLKYPQYDLVGVTDLDIYDVVNSFSARVKGGFISEASMCFKKSFWEERHFPDQFSTLGEGYPFTKQRRNRILKMPSCPNIIAMTHYTNYTQEGRSYNRFKDVKRGDNILRILDDTTRLFVFDLFEKVRKKIESSK